MVRKEPYACVAYNRHITNSCGQLESMKSSTESWRSGDLQGVLKKSRIWVLIDDDDVKALEQGNA